MGEYVNSKQLRFDKSHISCGLLEVHHLPDQSPRTSVFSIANALYHKANGRPSAFVAFSDVVDRKDSRGVSLAQEIEKLNMGDLHEIGPEVNPRTGNKIVIWIWHLDHEKFRKWYVEEYAARIEE